MAGAVRFILVSSVVLQGVALVEMLFALRTIRSRVEWAAIFFPIVALLFMDLWALADHLFSAPVVAVDVPLSVASLVLSAGAIVGVAVLVRFIRARQTLEDSSHAVLVQQQEQLAYLADHDALTGLPNRRAFEAEVERAGAFARRGVSSTILFADVDGFKACNDSFGHPFGDAVLREIAESMRACVRDIDMVARIGGDEFGVILRGEDADAQRVASARLSKAVRDAGLARGLDLGLSIGASCLDADADIESVLAEADSRMYEAKAAAQGR